MMYTAPHIGGANRAGKTTKKKEAPPRSSQIRDWPIFAESISALQRLGKLPRQRLIRFGTLGTQDTAFV